MEASLRNLKNNITKGNNKTNSTSANKSDINKLDEKDKEKCEEINSTNSDFTKNTNRKLQYAVNKDNSLQGKLIINKNKNKNKKSNFLI